MSSEIDTLKLELRPFVKRSVTTGPGNAPGTTLVDTGLTEPNDFWNDMAILIRTGACAGELRRILDWDLATNTLTVNVAFSAQIVAAVQYVMFFPTIQTAFVKEIGVSDKATVQATESGDTDVIAAPGEGSHLKVKTIHVFNSGAAEVAVGLKFTAAGDLHYRANLAANTGYNMNLTHDDWHGGDNEAFIINLSVAGTVDVTIGYETETP